MKRFLLVGALLAACALPLCGQSLLTVSWTGQAHTIDATTGSGSLLGPVGFSSLNSLARDPVSGSYYTMSNTTLVSVDPATGQGTGLGSFAVNTVAALAVDSQGTLHAIVNGTPDSLYTFDPASGTPTLIGSTGLQGIQGLAFDPLTGQLFGWDVGFGSGNGVGLVTIDPATGIATDVDPATGGSANDVQWLAFDSSGRIYGGRSSLYTIDRNTGALTLVGSGGYSDTRGADFLGAGPVGPYTLSIGGASTPAGYEVAVDVTGGTPGSGYFTCLTLTQGAFPNGYLFGLDPTPVELNTQLLAPIAPYNGTLDQNGAALFRLPLPGPLGVTLYGVSFEFSGGQLLSISNPESGGI